MIIDDVITYFETRYPPSIRDLQYDEKNTGLLYGNTNTRITNIVVSLECSLEAIEFALSQNANFIICHHTPFFKPIEAYNHQDYRVQVLKQLILNDIAVYCSHTAIDRAKPEYNMSGMIAHSFGFTNIRPLEQDKTGYGLGVIADIKQVDDIQNILHSQLNTLRTNNLPLDAIKTVAIVGGSGEYYWKMAKAKGCDALLTGDVTYHAAQDARREHFPIIDIGHEAESLGMKYVAAWLEEKYPTVFFQQKEQILR